MTPEDRATHIRQLMQSPYWEAFMEELHLHKELKLTHRMTFQDDIDPYKLGLFRGEARLARYIRLHLGADMKRRLDGKE